MELLEQGMGHAVIETWFKLRDGMLIEGKTPTGARPPALRDACYAYSLAHRTMTDTSPETIESFVNGLELGALQVLREAWESRGSSMLSKPISTADWERVVDRQCKPPDEESKP